MRAWATQTVLRRGHGIWGLLSVACVLAYGGCVAEAVAEGVSPWEAAWSLATVPDVLVALGALAPGRVWVDGEWYRVLSAGLLHGSALHLFVNLWSLWAVAPPLDDAAGPVTSLGIFLGGVAAGSLASLAAVEGHVVVGASAGIVAQAGALWVLRSFGAPPVRSRIADVRSGALLLSLGLLVAVGFFVPVIAQAGHLGGLLLGAAVGAARRTDPPRPLAILAAAGFVLLPLFALAYAPAWSARYHEEVGARALARGAYARAQAAFDRALAMDPDDPVLKNAVAYALALAGRDLHRAEGLARQAVAADPENADYLDTLGWVLCRAGRPAEGLAVLRQAETAADPVFPELTEHLRDCTAARADEPGARPRKAAKAP